ncbi:alcohol dehydrogenase [Paecilomyces variotii No. 5]|uniref:D-xylulose reductase n=1 Tax=Byssochlamys spectabilis (strain No. 5 / NBRC 109023) TaxID=1356009 RepID=V5I5L8_BYSSN|nr:alcohol dehydrogenase [Paecilomyces variotii No. 5]
MNSAVNPSCLLYGPFDARFEDRPLPEINDPNDVIVKIAYTGVCGSDVHFWLHGGIRAFVSETHPLTMGHEASGVIHKVGSAVTSLAPGDKVAIEPGYPCRRCGPCKSGRYNLCPEMKFAAAPPKVHGTLTKYFLLPADFCYKIPDTLSLTEAVLIEPLAVAVHTVRLADIKPGHRVIVYGAGTVGLLCAAVAREFGASQVISVDILESKLSFARKFIGESIGRTAMPDRSLSAEDNANLLVQNLNLGEGANIAIDASGAEASMQAAIYVLRRGGTYVQAGMGKRKIEFPIAEMCEKEITAKGCFRYGPGDFDLAIHLATSKLRLSEFVTKIVPFEQAPEAWETTKRGEGIKTLIKGPE